MTRLRAAWDALRGHATIVPEPQAMTCAIRPLGRGAALTFHFDNDPRELTVMLPRESAVAMVDGLVDALALEETEQ